MNYADLKKEVERLYGAAFALNDIIPETFRKKAEKIVAALFFINLLLHISIFAVKNFSSALPTFSKVTSILQYEEQIYGLLLIIFSIYATLLLLKFFYRSYYFRDINFILHETGVRSGDVKVDFETCIIIHNTDDSDITSGFLNSVSGREIMRRMNIDNSKVEKFLTGERPSISLDTFHIDSTGSITLSKYAQSIFSQDDNFSKFLFSHGIQEDDFIGTALWIQIRETEARKGKRWWSRDILGRIPGIGKGFAYGQTYLVEQYSRDIVDGPVFASAQARTLNSEEVNELEAILARASQSNAIIVGEEGIGKLEIIARLAGKIKNGIVLPPLEHKNIIIFDSTALIASTKVVGVFEETFIKILNQTNNAGNIILVFDNFPLFIQNARALGSDVISIMKSFFDSENLQIIATSGKQQFHKIFESNVLLSRYFETIFVKSAEGFVLMRLLERKADELELRNAVLFTYLALKEIAEGATRYFPGGVMPDKALDLLVELVPYAKQRKKTLITKKDIDELIESKTDIKLGDVGEKEQEKLLNLEELLHRHIIGQDSAVNAISSAMRRSRAGISNKDKPIGSFLFFGPTGVGKTQTAKALAEVFFGNEESIVRIDMSEYNTVDALDKLIGSFTSNKPGVLASMLREKPYGIVLLDEFEKADPKVLNLFLRILDEGKFSDAQGKTISTRNSIIIATSNAASIRIWEYFNQNKDVSEYKDELVDDVVKRGIFRPELLNRFDGVIIFHPLDEEHIRKIAVLLLEKLKKRLKEKGLNLIINDTIIESVVKRGYNPKFGARPMNRAIQEKIEQTIAEKMIRKEIKSGDTVELTEDDLV